MKIFDDHPTLRPPTDRRDAEKRNALIERAIAMRREIHLNINTVNHWNSTHPDEQPIDPDPDGQYAEMLRYLNRLIDGAVQ